MNIGNKIRQARKEKKLTQVQLAKILGITQISLNRYENNKRKISPEILKKIADGLQKDINYFFYDDHDNMKIEDLEKREMWEMIIALTNGDKKTALGFLRMLRDGKAGKGKEVQDVFEEFIDTLKVTKENQVMIKKLLLMIKATGQDKLEALLKLLK